MSPKSKAIITVVLVGIVVGVFVLQVQNENLFQGRIFEGAEEEPAQDQQIAPTELPDLAVDLVALPPEPGDEDIILDVTLKNIGTGPLLGTEAYTYTIYLNDINIFTNADTYSSIEPGDAFNFKYPVSKQIYNYSDQGSARVVIDEENSIQESNEDNNDTQINYDITQL